VAAGSWQTVAVAVLALALASLPASEVEAAGKGGSGRSGASGGRHSGKGHSGHHQHRHSSSAVAAGVFVGGAYWPWWDYPAYYPVIAVESVPVEYIERSEQEAQTPGDWLYCARTQGYFPYVGECAEGWERVPAAPLK